MTHPADVLDIARQAAILVGKAEAMGVTLRISVEPLKPLAIGNHRHVVETWAARHPPTPLQAAGALWRKPELSDRDWAAQPANLREGCTQHVPGVGDI
jgi:hypothetical protein